MRLPSSDGPKKWEPSAAANNVRRNTIMEISAKLVKELRDRTGAGMMECKSALIEAKGNLPEAEIILRKRGISSASKKSSRVPKQGVIGTDVHPG